VTLTFNSTRPVELLLGEQRFGLPPDGQRLAAARGNLATTVRTGDTTIVFGGLRVP